MGGRPSDFPVPMFDRFPPNIEFLFLFFLDEKQPYAAAEYEIIPRALSCRHPVAQPYN